MLPAGFEEVLIASRGQGKALLDRIERLEAAVVEIAEVLAETRCDLASLKKGINCGLPY